MTKEEELQKKADEAQDKVDDIEETLADTEGAPQEDIDSLKSELAQAKQDLEKWQKEAKAHQTTASKKAQEAQEAQRKLDKIDSIEARLDILAEMIEERGSEPDGYEEKKKPSYRERLQEREKDKPDPKVTEQQNKMREYAQEIQSMLPKDVDFGRDKRFREAYKTFMLGDYELAVIETKEIVDKMANEKSQEDDRDKEIAELKKKLEAFEKKKEGLESGELVSETGQSIGSPKTDLEWEKSYVEGKTQFKDLPDSVKVKIRR